MGTRGQSQAPRDASLKQDLPAQHGLCPSHAQSTARRPAWNDLGHGARPVHRCPTTLLPNTSVPHQACAMLGRAALALP